MNPHTIDRWTNPAAYRAHRPRLLRKPDDTANRLTLYALRRMAAQGLHDAHAANLMLSVFGLPFRRPLVLLRTIVFELSRTSRRTITLAPCCCASMTRDEARLLAVLRHAQHDESRAMRHLSRLGGIGAASGGMRANTGELAGLLCAAAAYGCALADLGQPLGPPIAIV